MLKFSLTLTLMTFFLFSPNGRADETPKTQFKLECTVFHFDVADNLLQKATKIAEKSSEVMTIGTTTHLWLQLPEPFSDMYLAFNHFIVGYLENEIVEPLPYTQAFFMKENSVVTAPLTVSFSFDQFLTPGKLLLRDHFNYSDRSMLTYQCSIHLF